MKLSIPLVLLAVLLLLSVPASADIIVLHNTGEGLMAGSPDPNWTVVRLDGTFPGQAISAIDRTDHDPAGWITPTSGNTWISTVAQGNIAPGVYKYTTTFVIGPGLDLSTATLSGYWWADDAGFNHDTIHWNGIYLNGVKVSNFEGGALNDPDWNQAFFSINSGFVSGVNVLTFWVGTYNGPGGILVQGLSGSVSRFDTDGDGVPDATDQCPNSILTPTVVINECDSNAPNHLFTTGCTLSDLIAEATASANGQCEFVGAVGFITNGAMKSGAISGSQKGAIQKCAAKARIP